MQYRCSFPTRYLSKLTGGDFPRFMGCMKDNTTKVRNIKNYLLSALFNAPTTMGSYYQSEVSHDQAYRAI
ncbi:DUF6017 domain-containing protein [Butyrivibrio sp. WCD2001]|uniref:DUF6017 domain-containing protein n=1 Tax=Butyrivibrio sp. WCD2001 TaxID=1280681 RepID=UPI00210FCE4F|nr:DUF6017 domain-containing protein [Butyrivibrio sp. WCD2001]